MLFNRRYKKLRKRQNAWLYSTVFHGVFSTLLTVSLMVSFLVQPFHKAMAAEPFVDEEVPAPIADEVKEQIPDDPSLPEAESPPEIVQEQEVIPEEQSQTAEDTVTETGSSGAEEEPQVEDVIPEEVVEEVIDETVVEEVPTDDTPPENTESVSEEDTDTVVSDEVPQEQVVQLQNLVTEDNFYQFSKQSCVAVGDGTYHCSTSGDTAIDTSSVVYAELGEAGNMEIFLRTSKNKVKQITNNAYDDLSPHYDAESMKIVWHRLIDGRYQIVTFDIMENEETQLTFSKTNNMEPKVSDAGVVWQAWDNNDWEIMLFDGSYTEQLTENDTQDVAPVIQDGYVLWNVLGGEEQQARVYSLDTKEVVSIEGYEGGAISNPRFVLVYDTKYDNGDIVTQSFDPATGLSEPIAATPAAQPINIPESDPVGEIRALISNKSKDENLFVEVDTDGGDDVPPVGDGTLDLKSGEGEDVPVFIATTTPNQADFELTEYDLVIPEGALERALLGD